jgi:hypothetical protein
MRHLASASDGNNFEKYRVKKSDNCETWRPQNFDLNLSPRLNHKNVKITMHSILKPSFSR